MGMKKLIKSVKMASLLRNLHDFHLCIMRFRHCNVWCDKFYVVQIYATSA